MTSISDYTETELLPICYSSIAGQFRCWFTALINLGVFTLKLYTYTFCRYHLPKHLRITKQCISFSQKLFFKLPVHGFMTWELLVEPRHQDLKSLFTSGTTFVVNANIELACEQVLWGASPSESPGELYHLLVNNTLSNFRQIPHFLL